MTRTPAPSILIAEDSLVVRTIVRRHLVEQGYAVLEAEDGEVALQACRADHPDVVLLDVEMPGLDGHQVLQALKADPALSSIPVVFLTGRTSTEDVVAGLALGAHDYLKKPFEPAELLARVSSAVRLKSVQDELKRRNADLEHLSRTDALTGLHNRRHIEEQLAQHAGGARRHGHDLAVLMLDIDHFKAVNDTVGHAGGEEFLVVCPYTDLGGAAAVGERFRAVVAGEPFVLADGKPIAVSLSGGCASGRGEDPEGLVRAADAALYQAKFSGRNRIVTSSDPH